MVFSGKSARTKSLRRHTHVFTVKRLSFLLDGVTVKDGGLTFDSLATGAETRQACLQYLLQVHQDKDVQLVDASDSRRSFPGPPGIFHRATAARILRLSQFSLREHNQKFPFLNKNLALNISVHHTPT